MRLLTFAILMTIVVSLPGLRYSAAIPDAQIFGTSQNKHLIDQVSVLELERYEDPDYGFSLAIPSGWRRLVPAQIDSTLLDDTMAYEKGYALGFELPQSDSADNFADYILIELLPGEKLDLFDASEAEHHYIDMNERRVAYDRLTIDGDKDVASDVDLVIFQHGTKLFGYTLAFYAIGEPSNEQILFDAFQIMVLTYAQNRLPFTII